MNSREETIVEMLRRYNEAQDPSAKSGLPGTGEHVPLMPATWNTSFRELERCLKQLRDERKSQYWHLCERYVRAEVKTVLCGVRKAPNGQRELRLPPHSELVAGAPVSGESTAYVRLRVWSPAVRPEKARRGVEWISDNFRGEPFLPSEMTQEAA